MERKATSGIMLTLLLTSMLTLAVNIQQVKASGTIYIRPDGSVEGTDKIQRNGDVYAFSGDIYDEIVVERSGIIIDGDGHTLQGSGGGNGFYLYGTTNVTIKSVIVIQFYTGIYLLCSTNNTIAENTVSSNSQGINVYQSTSCNVSNNVVTSNQGGIIVYQGSDYTTVENNTVSSGIIGMDLGMANWCTITRNSITNNFYGMMVSQSSHDTIAGNSITTNNNNGIYLYESSNNCISGNMINTNGGDGIYFGDRSNSNNASGNMASNNYRGICLAYCSDNDVSANVVFSNWGGIHLIFSMGNRLTGNNMTDNLYNFGVYGSFLSHFVHEIDTSNTADDKPVYYLVNQEDSIIEPSTLPQIGYLGLVNSTNIVVRDLTLMKNHDGVLFAYVTDSTIENVNVSNNLNGISFVGSNGNTITRSISSDNEYRGIWLFDSSDNSVSRCTVSHNSLGIFLEYSNANTIHHNNFSDNAEQIYDFASTNTWDDGFPSGGNYWSDYGTRYPDAQELDDSGIWGTPYVIDEYNQDRYPLMEPWTPPQTVVADIDIAPDTFNLQSKGKWITAFIQLPEGYSVADIDVSTIMLNGTVAPVLDSTYDFVTNSSEYLVDYNNDGVLERMVKFDRASLASWICQSVGMQHEVSLTITGELTDGTSFEGTDIIFVVHICGGCGGRRK